MLCPFCSAYASDDEIVCPKCGKLLPRRENREEGVMAIRQGKRAQGSRPAQKQALNRRNASKPPVTLERRGTGRTWVDPAARASTAGQIPVYAAQDVYDAQGEPLTEDDGLPMDRVHRATVYGETGTREIPHIDPRPSSRVERKRLKQHAINWAKMSVAFAVLIFLLIGAVIFLRTTDAGQKILASMGRDASSTAYWEIGEEKMDTGDIAGAIEAFERAKGIDDLAAEQENAQVNVNVAGLLMLASTYEAAGRTADAEAIYVDLYTNVVPTAPDAYTMKSAFCARRAGRPRRPS